MTPAGERELRSQGRRTMAKLLDAGMQVLAERGYHAARVDDVVRKARTSHGTFYLYFANKEDLFRALAHECAEEMRRWPPSSARSRPTTPGTPRCGPGSPASTTRTSATAPSSGRGWRTRSPTGRWWHSASTRSPTSPRSLVGRIGDAEAAHVPDPELAAAALLAMVERLIYFTTTHEVGVDDDTLLDTLAGLVHRGFFGAPAA